MSGRSFRIGRIAGIPVGINPWWLAIVLLFTWELGANYYPSLIPHLTPAAAYGLGLASVLLLFASVLAHEFGHAIVARRRGVEVEEIDLWLLGGVSRMSGHPKTPQDEQAYALAGPAVTAVIAAVFAALTFLLPGSVHSPGRALVEYQFEMNVVLLVFNLLPAFPLDGGRVARAVLWRRRGDFVAATETAANVGRACGYAMIGGGVLLTFGGWAIGLWLAVIGLFIVVAAGAERQQEEVVAAFTGVTVTALMSAPAACLPAGITLGEARAYFARYRYSAFPVTDAGGRAVGLLSIEQLERAPEAELSQRRVSERADRDPQLMVPADTDVAQLLEMPAFARTGHAVVVDDDGRPLGVVSGTDIQRAIRASRLGGGARRQAG
ncbi:MAG TPA: site-2 protease family protein [Solirubrobacteraceae bacterium]|nr:site-2 protease family protein [Solirubrobacteraceae bacterium]